MLIVTKYSQNNPSNPLEDTYFYTARQTRFYTFKDQDNIVDLGPLHAHYDANESKTLTVAQQVMYRNGTTSMILAQNTII